MIGVSARFFLFLIFLALPLHSAIAGEQPELVKCFAALERYSFDGHGNQLGQLPEKKSRSESLRTPASENLNMPPTLAIPGQRNRVDGYYLYTEGKVFFQEGSHVGNKFFPKTFQTDFRIGKRATITCQYDVREGQDSPRLRDCFTPDRKTILVQVPSATAIGAKEDPEGPLRSAILARIQGLTNKLRQELREYTAQNAAADEDREHPPEPTKILGWLEVAPAAPSRRHNWIDPRVTVANALESCQKLEDESIRTAALTQAALLKSTPAPPRKSRGAVCTDC